MAEEPRIDAVISATEHWSEYLEDLHARIAHRFRRPEVKKRIGVNPIFRTSDQVNFRLAGHV
jgi:hypothetical protein